MKLLAALLPTILFTAYSQLVIKWRVATLAASTDAPMNATSRTVHYLTDPYVISAYVAALLGAIAWLYVAERHPVSIAFPTYIGVLFAVVTTGSAFLLREAVSAHHLVGTALILAGVIIVSRAT